MNVRVQMLIKGAWQELPPLTEKTQPGTITGADGELILFGWLPKLKGGDGAPGVWRMDGHHHLVDDGVNRVTTGTPVKLSGLAEPYEFVNKLGVKVRLEVQG